MFFENAYVWWYLTKKCHIFENHSNIAATQTCKDDWKLEFPGYLMAGYHGHVAATSYTCIDNDPESLHGGGNINSNGYLFYMVAERCGSLKCPPYVEGREIVCVVCSLE